MDGLRETIFEEEMRRFMVTKDQLILLVRDYTFDDEDPWFSFDSVRKGGFEEQSYRSWAAEELICYLRMNKDLSPVEAVAEFAQQSKRFATWNEKSKNAFTVAYELAVNILDVCRGAGWVEE